MSVTSEITRIQTAKADIKASIEAKGVTVPSDALIDEYADYVEQIQTGGGGGQAEEDLKNLIERDVTAFIIPSGTTKIRDYAFTYCDGLTSVTIGNGVTSIGKEAFRYCLGLTSVTIQATTPPTLGKQAFDNTSANLVIYCPAESVDTYKAAKNWSSLASRIKPISE